MRRTGGACVSIGEKKTESTRGAGRRTLGEAARLVRRDGHCEDAAADEPGARAEEGLVGWEGEPRCQAGGLRAGS